MISIDSNLLLYAFAKNLPEHTSSRAFLASITIRADVVISEFVLVEFYRLLRLPVLHERPLSAGEAVEVIQSFRQHPRWQIISFTSHGMELHNELWKVAAHPGFAYRRIYDARLALTLRHHGVKEFATANVRDFQGFGFDKVWNPIIAETSL